MILVLSEIVDFGFEVLRWFIWCEKFVFSKHARVYGCLTVLSLERLRFHLDCGDSWFWWSISRFEVGDDADFWDDLFSYKNLYLHCMLMFMDIWWCTTSRYFEILTGFCVKYSFWLSLILFVRVWMYSPVFVHVIVCYC